jgi:TRAP-type mannitol/chloroaromatic compound transport system substrate-binding protein
MKSRTQIRERTSRRRFLSGAAMAGAAMVAAPSVVKAQGPVSMRFQSTWPSKDIFHEFAQDFAKKVNDTTGGDLKIEVLPAGAVVPAFGLLDAVSQGTLDGGHGVVSYHYGKQAALALWGSGPGFAMDANMLLAWHKYGGGRELLEKLYQSIGANVVSFLYGPMPTQPLGWFKKPVAKVEDFQGLKFRTVGISIDVFTGLGAAVNALPGGEIVAALTAACWTRPSSTTPRPTGPSVSRTSPRSACCKVFTRTPSSSRCCSTRRNTTRCLTRPRRSSPMPRRQLPRI